MMTMVEAAFVLLNAFNAHSQAFLDKAIGISSLCFAVDSFHDKRPIHHFITVKQVTCEDQFEDFGIRNVVFGGV